MVSPTSTTKYLLFVVRTNSPFAPILRLHSFSVCTYSPYATILRPQLVSVCSYPPSRVIHKLGIYESLRTSVLYAWDVPNLYAEQYKSYTFKE
jgi:hypothetical protein